MLKIKDNQSNKNIYSPSPRFINKVQLGTFQAKQS